MSGSDASSEGFSGRADPDLTFDAIDKQFRSAGVSVDDSSGSTTSITEFDRDDSGGISGTLVDEFKGPENAGFGLFSTLATAASFAFPPTLAARIALGAGAFAVDTALGTGSTFGTIHGPAGAFLGRMERGISSAAAGISGLGSTSEPATSTLGDAPPRAGAAPVGVVTKEFLPDSQQDWRLAYDRSQARDASSELSPTLRNMVRNPQPARGTASSVPAFPDNDRQQEGPRQNATNAVMGGSKVKKILCLDEDDPLCLPGDNKFVNTAQNRRARAVARNPVIRTLLGT